MLEIEKITKQISDITNQAYQVYLPIVNDICVNQVSLNELEHILDYLLDFTYDDKILELFKRVCKHYLLIYPKTIQFYINSYKEMWI